MVIAAAAGAFATRRATVAGRGAAGELALIAAIAETEHLLTIIRHEAAPGAATIFPKHPHVEGGIVVELGVQSAPPDHTTRAGKRLPAGGQGQAPGCGDL